MRESHALTDPPTSPMLHPQPMVATTRRTRVRTTQLQKLISTPKSFSSQHDGIDAVCPTEETTEATSVKSGQPHAWWSEELPDVELTTLQNWLPMAVEHTYCKPNENRPSCSVSPLSSSPVQPSSSDPEDGSALLNEADGDASSDEEVFLANNGNLFELSHVDGDSQLCNDENHLGFPFLDTLTNLPTNGTSQVFSNNSSKTASILSSGKADMDGWFDDVRKYTFNQHQPEDSRRSSTLEFERIHSMPSECIGKLSSGQVDESTIALKSCATNAPDQISTGRTSQRLVRRSTVSVMQRGHFSPTRTPKRRLTEAYNEREFIRSLGLKAFPPVPARLLFRLLAHTCPGSASVIGQPLLGLSPLLLELLSKSQLPWHSGRRVLNSRQLSTNRSDCSALDVKSALTGYRYSPPSSGDLSFPSKPSDSCPQVRRSTSVISDETKESAMSELKHKSSELSPYAVPANYIPASTATTNLSTQLRDPTFYSNSYIGVPPTLMRSFVVPTTASPFNVAGHACKSTMNCQPCALLPPTGLCQKLGSRSKLCMHMSGDGRPTTLNATETPCSHSDSISPGVLVDLTGYDVTVSVERLPPVQEVTSHHFSKSSATQPRYRDRFRLQSKTFDQFSPPKPDAFSSVSDCLQSLLTRQPPPPFGVPLSPPPPYSECVYSNRSSATEKQQQIPSPALSQPFSPLLHAGVLVPINYAPPPTTVTLPTTWAPFQPYMVWKPPPTSASTCTCQVCIYQTAPVHLVSSASPAPTKRPYANRVIELSSPCHCSRSASPHHASACSDPTCASVSQPPPSPMLTTTSQSVMSSRHYPPRLTGPSAHLMEFKRPCPLGDKSADCSSYGCQCCRHCHDHRDHACCSDRHWSSNSSIKGTSERLFQTADYPVLDNCRTPHWHQAAAADLATATRASLSQYVCVPEPIRLSRSKDVYNALRTCLVPHQELRDYFSSAPPQRQWRKLEELSKDGFPFTLMCYNLLSPNYATPTMYPYCPSWALNWDYRRRFILDEIRMYHANIICLQEVETHQFEEIFKPELEKLKYDAVFLPKSRRRTMDLKDGKKVDGCAIFWQVDKFEKLHEFHHEFMLSCSSMCENPTPLMLNRVMTRDNVALGVIFQTKGPAGPEGTGGRQFCVTTGHIHWDPEHADVKMIQTILWTAELWAYIDQFLTGSGETNDRGSPTTTTSRNTPLSTRIPVPGPSSPAAHMPVILCGDLNSLPDSGVIEFLMRGSLPKSHTDFLNNGFKYMFEDWRLLEKWAVDDNSLRHRFKFDRAYRDVQGMRITNFTYDFKGMIDYVLYSRQHFRLLGSLDQIPDTWFTERKIVGCPHMHFPSDHFALFVELELKPTPQLAGRMAARLRARSSETSVTSDRTSQSVSASVVSDSTDTTVTDENGNPTEVDLNGSSKSRGKR